MVPTPGVSEPTFSVPRCPFARVRLAGRPDWMPLPATLRKNNEEVIGTGTPEKGADEGDALRTRIPVPKPEPVDS